MKLISNVFTYALGDRGVNIIDSKTLMRSPLKRCGSGRKILQHSNDMASHAVVISTLRGEIMVFRSVNESEFTILRRLQV